jgi:hypothetical protein
MRAYHEIRQAPSSRGDFEIDSPQAIYTQRLEENHRDRAVQRRWDRYFGYAKVAVAALGVFFLVRFVHELHGFGWVLATIVVYVILGVAHEGVLRRIRKIDGLIAYYERGMARLEDRWAGTGESGEQYIDEAHTYSRDLDLFGRGSMFELLCTFRTRAGQDTLAHWLLEPASPDVVRTRQSAVQELKDRAEFREELFTAGTRVRMGLRPELLSEWAERPFVSGSRTMAVWAIALATLWVAGVVVAFTNSIYWPVLLATFVNLIVNNNFVKRLGSSISGTEEATEDLDLLASVSRIIEKESFSTGRLLELERSLEARGIAASVAIRQLDRRTRAIEHRANLLIRFVDPFLFYTVLCALWIESWRSRFGARIRTWIATVGEVESLAALSCYTFEHPNDAWPEFRDAGPHFEAEMLAHPLLPEKQAVRNDVKLGDGLGLMILSGPNMSGKSTFVRGIGLNAVLAQCGAPVRARRLTLSRLAVGASICVLDSLQGGVSRFYAEIKRLKMISDLTRGPIPVLFLLDELLGGTNSHDRLQGSELLVRTFVEHGAIGLLTTHDLALTQIPESMNGQARNCHFDDHLEDGKLVFEFKLKEGIVQSSNALRLMESIGLLKQ